VTETFAWEEMVLFSLSRPQTVRDEKELCRKSLSRSRIGFRAQKVFLIFSFFLLGDSR
jgi:hypothetical protein